MYKLKSIDQTICDFCDYLNKDLEMCRNQYDIFGFANRAYTRSVMNFLNGKMIPYRVYHWVLFVFSWYGLVAGIFCFTQFLIDPDSVLLRNNHLLRSFSKASRRYYNFLHGFIHICAWASLFYGVLFVSPSHMIPWLCLYVFFLALNLISLMVNIYNGRIGRKISIPYVIYLFVVITWIVFIKQGMDAFRNALKVDQAEDLMLSIRKMETIVEYAFFVINHRN